MLTLALIRIAVALVAVRFPKASLVEVEGADHNDVWLTNGGEAYQTIVRFVNEAANAAVEPR
jgi:hypothetical protein